MLLVMPNDDQATNEEGLGGQDDRSWWKDNSTVIITVLSVAVVALRLLTVSLGDPATAYAILQIGGTGTVLVATLVSTVGLLAIPACVIFGFYYFKHPKRDKLSSTQRRLMLGSTAILFCVALYMSPLLFLLYGIAFLVPVFFISEKLRTSFLPAYAFGYIVAGLLFGLIFSPTPWLPAQAISVAGQKPFSGYVLSQANGETFILTSNPEGVISVSSQKIRATEQ